MLPSHSAVLTYSHYAVLSYHYTVIPSYCHTITLPYYHTAIPAYCHTIKPSHPHTVILSNHHTLIPSYCHTIVLSYSRTVMLPYHRIVILSYMYHHSHAAIPGSCLQCVFEVGVESGLLLTEVAEGVSVEDVRAATGASFEVSSTRPLAVPPSTSPPFSSSSPPYYIPHTSLFFHLNFLPSLLPPPCLHQVSSSLKPMGQV